MEIEVIAAKRELQGTGASRRLRHAGKVPLHFLYADTAPGVKTGGGKVRHVATEIDVACLPGNLPEFIAVDMGALEIGHAIHANDLVLPAGVELVAHVQQEN